MNATAIFAVIVAIAYLMIQLGRKQYLRESFQDEPTAGCRTVLDTSQQSPKAFMRDEDKQGDFEQDVVFQNEGGFDPTKEAINMARRRFPFDWSQLPPSSSLFQAQQALFVKEPAGNAAPFTKETFEDIESKKVLPSDGSAEQAEIDALKAQQPKATADMKSVDEGSVNQLIEKIQGDKGLVAWVAKKANNVFEVQEVQEKNPKIVQEDEPQQASIQSNTMSPMVEPSQMLVVPNAVSDLEVGLTPQGRGESVGLKRQEQSDYNPNLEGIFGPRMQWQQWG